MFVERLTCKTPTQQKEVTTLLAGLNTMYPDADVWLPKRLNDVKNQEAWCWGVHKNTTLIGVIIVKPKSRGTKISPIFVDPAHRHQGAGTLLMETVTSKNNPSRNNLYVTVPETVYPQLEPLLTRYGFAGTHLVLDRYGAGRNEWVFMRT